MRGIVLEPGYSPYVASFTSSEEAIREVIEGEHEIVFPFQNNVIALICSKEQSGLAFNRNLDDEYQINGKALIFRWKDQRITSLTPQQAARYCRRYMYTEKRAVSRSNGNSFELIALEKPRDERFGKKPILYRER